MKTGVALLFVLAAWEAAVRVGFLPALIVAAPSAIVVAAWSDGPIFAAALWLTFVEILIACVIAWSGGIAIGLVAGTSPHLSRPAALTLSALFAVPMSVFYPLFIVWFGLGAASKIVFGALLGVFPIALNTLNGVRAIDPRYRRMARAVGASRSQTFVQVLVPLALPAIASGLRIGTGLVVIGVLSAEVLGSLGGLGYLVSDYGSQFEAGHIYLSIFLALALVYIANRGVVRLERRLGFWRQERTD